MQKGTPQGQDLARAIVFAMLMMARLTGISSYSSETACGQQLGAAQKALNNLQMGTNDKGPKCKQDSEVKKFNTKWDAALKCADVHRNHNSEQQQLGDSF
eukprot:3041953-Amphidinium_carterae.1